MGWQGTLPSALGTCFPVPFETSLRTIARKEGWEPETFMAPFLSNIGWMEHPGTRLRLQPDEEHRRGCVVQIVCAGDPSMLFEGVCQQDSVVAC